MWTVLTLAFTPGYHQPFTYLTITASESIARLSDLLFIPVTILLLDLCSYKPVCIVRDPYIHAKQ